MKVKELIEQLKKMDGELLCLVEGYEGGYDDILLVTVKTVVDESIPYSGSYQEDKKYYDGERIKAVIIWGDEK